MRNTFHTILGAMILLMAFYTIGTLVQIIFGWTEIKLSEITIPLVIISIFFIAMVIGYYKKDEKNKTKKISVNSVEQNQPWIEKEREYNPEIDKLNYTIYEQYGETWWSDSDGDSHTRPTVYANLRFYEDGALIGLRDRGILKIENIDSFVYKGNWEINEDKIKIILNKVKDIDDSVYLYISPEEKRDMKYAGHITHDSDLIKEGIYQGVLRESTIKIGNFLFRSITPSRLIITATEASCNELQNKFKNHPLVLNSYTDSGNWYTNGETGSEWYTVTFESRYELREQLENDIKKSSSDYSNMFWG